MLMKMVFTRIILYGANMQYMFPLVHTCVCVFVCFSPFPTDQILAEWVASLLLPRRMDCTVQDLAIFV